MPDIEQRRGETADSTADTLAHRQAVAHNILTFTIALQRRAIDHDRSKLGPDEKPTFDKYPRETCPPFGTPEYEERRAALGRALEHHYRVNSHHPEHFENGIEGMTLIDLLEMFCDWMSRAAERPDDEALSSLEHCRERFGVSAQLHSVFLNTYQTYFALNEANAAD